MNQLEIIQKTYVHKMHEQAANTDTLSFQLGDRPLQVENVDNADERRTVTCLEIVEATDGFCARRENFEKKHLSFP
jgi:hypothetical protein